MKKTLICTLSLLTLLLALSACTVQTSPNGDKQSQTETTPPSSAAYVAQIQQLCAEAPVIEQIDDNQKYIELTPEIKEQFFDLAQQERWDFLPSFGFDGSAPPTDMDDYIYLVIAQSLVWQDYYNIDQQKTPEKLSAEHVDEFLSARFGQPIPHPEPGAPFKGIEFDGEYYTSDTEWAYLPLYGLSLLLVDNSNPNTTIYEASLLSYNPEDEVPENVREIICSMDEAKPGLTAAYQLHVRFYFDDNGVPVYLAVE